MLSLTLACCVIFAKLREEYLKSEYKLKMPRDCKQLMCAHSTNSLTPPLPLQKVMLGTECLIWVQSVLVLGTECPSSVGTECPSAGYRVS